MTVNENVNDEAANQDTDDKGKGQEIDWSKVDPASIPHEVAKDSGAFKGLLKETADLREETRGNREEMGSLKAQVEALTNVDDDEGDRVAPDDSDNDYVTKADLKREREKDRKQDDKAAQKKAHDTRVEFENESMTTARETFTEEAQGEGFDFDAVMATGKAHMARHHPGACQAALRDDRDPAGALYWLYRSLVPELRQKDRAIAGSQTLDQVKEAAIGKTGGAGSKTGTADVSKLSGPALEAELEKDL